MRASRVMFVVLVVAGAALALAGCTGTPADTDSPGVAINPTPADGDESQDVWADLKERVLTAHPDAEYSGVGSSAQATSFHLSPPTTADTTGLVVAVDCRGGGKWTVRVDQEHPRMIRGTCDGSDTAIPDAVALDPHETGVLFRVTPPSGARFWSVAFYTH